MFSSMSFMVLILIFRLLIHFVLIYVYGVRLESSLSFLECVYPVAQVPFIEETSFSIEWASVQTFTSVCMCIGLSRIYF